MILSPELTKADVVLMFFLVFNFISLEKANSIWNTYISTRFAKQHLTTRFLIHHPADNSAHPLFLSGTGILLLYPRIFPDVHGD